MDVLTKYTQTKEELNLVSKKLFQLLESKDIYCVMQAFSLGFLELSEIKTSQDHVLISLYNFKDQTPIIEFTALREDALTCSESILIPWNAITKELTLKTCIQKVSKFFKTFEQADHALIRVAITNYEELNIAGLKDSEISEACAKHYVKILENQFTSANTSDNIEKS